MNDLTELSDENLIILLQQHIHLNACIINGTFIEEPEVEHIKHAIAIKKELLYRLLR